MRTATLTICEAKTFLLYQMGDNTYKHKIVYEGYHHLKIANSLVFIMCLSAVLKVYTD